LRYRRNLPSTFNEPLTTQLNKDEIMLPDLHLLSTKNLKKLFLVQSREFSEAVVMQTSANDISTIELTLQQLSQELQGRSRSC
jgi:hypothetical protein